MMAVALMSKDENTVLIFAGRIMNYELLDNAALISSRVVGLTSYASFFIQLQMSSMGFTSGDCG